MVRLSQSSHSWARSHYCSPRGLLAAEFPPWPGSTVIRQPGRPRLLQTVHVDGVLSADTQSTWVTRWQGSWPQAIHNTRPPSSWITGARHDSRSTAESTSNQFQQVHHKHEYWYICKKIKLTQIVRFQFYKKYLEYENRSICSVVYPRLCFVLAKLEVLVNL